jgi:alpha-tubulin suppressor-like RCC1 family protein
MERRTNLGISNLLVLDQFFQSICSSHYPKEIVYSIITLYYKLFKIKIACGGLHFMLLFDTEVYAWGENSFGQLCLGHYNAIKIPTKINLSDVVKISCGGYHSIALTKTNDLHIWGNNSYHQLGQGTNINFVSCPMLIQASDFDYGSIKQISCGHSHSMILTKSGKVYAWGSNGCNQLSYSGQKDEIIRSPQKLILGNTTGRNLSVEKIACGGSSSMILTESGIIFRQGRNVSKHTHDNFRQKYEFDSPNVSDIICRRWYSVIIVGDEIYFSGKFSSDEDNDTKHLPDKIIFPNLRKLACGNNHFMAQNKLGEVYVLGYNLYGQLGLGDNVRRNQLVKLDLPPVKKIISRDSTSFAITKMNDIYAWGRYYTNKPVRFTF